jgi:hypothetical protein
MNADKVVVVLTATGALDVTIVIAPAQVAQVNGAWDTQTVKRLEQLWKDCSILTGIYGATQQGATETYLNEDGSEHFASTITQNNLNATRTKVAYP